MLTRLWAWMGRHRWRIFLAVFWSPVAYVLLFIILTPVHIWYYEALPFSETAVRLFAKPGEDTLMFRYRLGDRVFYVRSDMAQPARYSRRETEHCNPLWGECRVFPLIIRIYVSSDLNNICIDGYMSCLELSRDPKNKIEFWVEGKIYGGLNLVFDACYGDYYISTGGNFKDYFINRASGEQRRLCYLIQPDGVLASFLTAMETGNYEHFPYTRRADSAN